MTASATAAPVRARYPLERWAALGGVVYVVLFVIGAILAFNDVPLGDDPPGEVAAYFRDSGHRDRIGVGSLLVILGMFFFLWFLASLREALRRWDGGFLGTLALIGGTVYAALSAAAISIYLGIATMSDDTFNDIVYPGLPHAASDVWYTMHAAGGIGAGSMIVAASLAALRAARIPAWLGWLGVVAGIVSVFSIFFFPQIVLAISLIVMSVLLFLSKESALVG